ncbi:MAG TPA: M20/M25/M40 family metallo-hydrolase [Phycisphaerales bacterium]|nr:M20/M25/M40 family metallo-hydrolase [Phycisphaerales bacterium]HRQ75498.1 M20/M25/M40 family metallo-hydrolase [Phycisphaerales bacterium]
MKSSLQLATTKTASFSLLSVITLSAASLVGSVLWNAPAWAGAPVTDSALTASDRAELMERFNLAEKELDAVLRIIDEGKNRNQVVTHLTYLCEQIGPRLTGSPRAERANRWAAEQFESFGLTNIHLHEWGTIPVGFHRGPSTGKMLKPIEREFEFTTRSWSAGTNGPVEGRVFREPSTEEEYEAIRDYLEGAWILRPAIGGQRRGVVPGVDENRQFLPQLREAGIAGLITASPDDLVRTSGNRGWRQLSWDDLPTDVTVMVRRSDYDAMNSRLHDGEEVVVEFNLDHTFIEGPISCYNTVADIPGTEWPDEIVIVSGHIDSWDGPGSLGTIDNGTGTSVTIEAARILMAAGVKPKRTIRFILWTGEEQGLLGSRAYVAELSEEERAKISGVFVDDSGTNRQSSLPCIEAMVPILQPAIEAMNYAFPDMPVELRVQERMQSRRGGGGSDHASFNAVGIPGFFWGKTGRMEYRYGWHTQNDRLDQAVPEYLIQNSTVSAIVAYVVANAETLLPRDPAEEPAAEAEGDGADRPGRQRQRETSEVGG